MIIDIVALTKPLDTFRSRDGVILPRYMIGHKIDDNLHSCLVRAFYQTLKLFHSVCDINSHVRVNIIIVNNGIRRTCLALYD